MSANGSGTQSSSTARDAGAAVSAGGSILQAYGAIKSSQDQADFEEKRAGLMREQADEITQRQIANDAMMADRTFRGQLDFASSYAGSGKDGVGLASQLEMKRQSDLMTMIADRDTKFKADMLRQEAAINDQLAGDTRSSGWIAGAGTILSGAGHAAALAFL